MTGQTPVWQAGEAGTVFDPGRMNWGPPQGSCPVRVVVPPWAARGVRVELQILSHVDVYEPVVWLNAGAARWLGTRLIEAAYIAEQQTPPHLTPMQEPDPRKDPT